VILLARMGMVTLQQLKNIRPYFIVGAFIVAAVVTPPDVVSQLLLAIPMCLLYELGVFAARFFVRPPEDDDYRSPSDAAMDRQLDRVDTERK
jgi:sec-independent protein translocase protein TatC